MTELSQFSHSIDIAAPPRVVFTFLTTEEGMTAWMGQFAELDPRQGGRFAVDISGYPVRGQYLHVEPYSRVVVSWGFAGSDDLPPGASTVEFRLIEIEGGTRVEITHSDLPDSEVPGHAEGWEHFIPRLHEAAEGGRPGPDSWLPRSAPEPAPAPAPASPTPRSIMTESMANPTTVIQRYHRAWTSGDIDSAMDLVADDITCRAPGIDLTGKDQYRDFIGGFAPALTGLADIASFADGNRVALFYYPQTAATSTAPASECFTVENGLITDSVLIFDRLSFAPPEAS